MEEAIWDGQGLTGVVVSEDKQFGHGDVIYRSLRDAL